MVAACFSMKEKIFHRHYLTLMYQGFYLKDLTLKLNLRKKKRLLYCSYNLHKNQILNHIKEMGRSIDVFSSSCDSLILLGGFNVEPTEKHVKDFSLIYNCKNIIRNKTYCKNPENPKCIDLTMTNTPKSFQN